MKSKKLHFVITDRLHRGFYVAACGEEDGGELEQCVMNKTIGLEEFLVYNKSIDNFDIADFRFDITFSRVGRCYTLDTHKRMNSTFSLNKIDNLLSLRLKKKFLYRIIIHDENFYYFTGNPKALPGFWLEFWPSDVEKYEFIFRNIEINKISRLSTEERPCLSSTNIGHCIDAALAEKVSHY